MMGERKLSEIKHELRRVLNAPRTPTDHAKKRRLSKVEKELESFCAALRGALDEKAERTRKVKKPNGKKKPAA